MFLEPYGETFMEILLCKNEVVRWWVAVWLALVTALSLVPLKIKIVLGTVGVWHDVGHFLIFAATGVLVLWTADNARWRGFRAASLALLCATLEALEASMYHNPFEWRDVITDCLGICCGWIAAIVWDRFSGRKAASGL